MDEKLIYELRLDLNQIARQIIDVEAAIVKEQAYRAVVELMVINRIAAEAIKNIEESDQT